MVNKKKKFKEPKKIEANKEIEKAKELNLKQKQNRQIIWVIVLMSVLILIIVLIPLIRNNFINKFSYINLDWQKTKLGENIYYSIRIPVANNQNEITGSYAMNFRNDPRKLKNIETNLTEDLISFKKQNIVYIALNPSMENCGAKTTISLMNLAGFLRDFGNLNISSAVTDKKYAEENNLTYATCKTNQENTVVYINSGNKTMIKQTNKNCYELTYNNCEVFPVTEKFMIEIIKNYMTYFTKE